MEIEGKDGSEILLKKGSKRLFGRGLGFTSDDRTISRHHVSLELCENGNQANLCSGTKVCFEAIGKNPIWLHDSRNGEIRVFRRFEMGEMVLGDGFCVSAKRPVWFKLKRKVNEDEEERADKILKCQNEDTESERLFRGGDGDFGFESLDVSEIDPVKEFGFLVIGHEFDHYSKHMIHDIKNWDWFLGETKKNSEDDEIFVGKRRGYARRKRKLDGVDDSDDEDWMGESDDDVGVVAKLRQVSRPKYSSTRSKDHNRTRKATISSTGKKKLIANEEDSGKEDDDTLGGFIVNDGDVEQEEMDEDEEEEEKELYFDDEEDDCQ